MTRLSSLVFFCYNQTEEMENFKGKNVAVLGYGVEGESSVCWLLKQGARVTVCDQNEKVKDVTPAVKWQLGKDYLKNLENFDILVRSPGIPYLTSEIQEALQKGVQVTSQTKIFFDLCPSKIIGVTGTKGKGTTVALLTAMLRNSKIKNQNSKIWMGGNIGEPPLDFLDKINPKDWVVLELSSFQLQDLDKSPHIAVVLGVEVDHLDHHRSEKEYIEAKYNIVRHQTKNDFVVINADYLTSFEFGAQTKAQTLFFSRRKLVDQGAYVHWQNNRAGEIILKVKDEEISLAKTYDIHLRGLHNLENICAAAVASYLAGVKQSATSKIITTFKGLPYRLELIREFGGVKYYNDSASTNPQTTLAALRSFSEPIVLIAGGSEKGADFKELGGEISKRVKAAILIGKESERIRRAIEKSSNFNQNKVEIIIGLKNMKEIIDTVQTVVHPGDVVLLSPACASFDMFRNYQDRGEQFKKEVDAIS